MQSSDTSANSVEYDAAKKSVTAVTVFQAGLAEVRNVASARFFHNPVDVLLGQKNHRSRLEKRAKRCRSSEPSDVFR